MKLVAMYIFILFFSIKFDIFIETYKVCFSDVVLKTGLDLKTIFFRSWSWPKRSWSWPWTVLRI